VRFPQLLNFLVQLAQRNVEFPLWRVRIVFVIVIMVVSVGDISVVEVASTSLDILWWLALRPPPPRWI
jgi:hypothetical protein